MTTFRKYKKSDKKILTEFIKGYYKEDEPTYSKSGPNINKTINEFSKRPTKGSIYLFIKNKQIVGYAIIVYYWSNEWSGNWLIIDELYVCPDYRQKGIATKFFKFLKQNKNKTDVGIQLEVHPHNKKVISFYNKLGFKDSDNQFLILEF